MKNVMRLFTIVLGAGLGAQEQGQLVVLGDMGEAVDCVEAPDPSATVVARLDPALVVSVAGHREGLWIPVSLDGRGRRDCFLWWYLVEAFDPENPEIAVISLVYRLRWPNIPFARVALVHEHIFEGPWMGIEIEGEMEFFELLSLSNVASRIGFDQANYRPDIANWVQKHRERVVYDEPAGEWTVSANHFWDLHEKYREDPRVRAHRIAVTAAEHRFPGECEGFLPCYLSQTPQGIELYGPLEYLKRLPRGRLAEYFLDRSVSYLENLIPGEANGRGFLECGLETSWRPPVERVLSILRQATPEGKDIGDRVDRILEGLTQHCLASSL